MEAGGASRGSFIPKFNEGETSMNKSLHIYRTFCNAPIASALPYEPLVRLEAF